MSFVLTTWRPRWGCPASYLLASCAGRTCRPHMLGGALPLPLPSWGGVASRPPGAPEVKLEAVL